jgi:hypothetical protein
MDRLKWGVLWALTLMMSSCGESQQATSPEWIVDLAALSADVSSQGDTATLTFHSPALPLAFTDEPARNSYTPPAIESLLLTWDHENPVAPNATLSGEVSGQIRLLPFTILQKPELLPGGDLKMEVRFFESQAVANWQVNNPSLTIDDWKDCMSMMYHCALGGILMAPATVSAILYSATPDSLRRTLIAQGLRDVAGQGYVDGLACVIFAQACVFGRPDVNL